MNISKIRYFSSFFFFFLFITMSMSSSSSLLLSPIQLSTMDKLSELINNQTGNLWNPTTYPCSWHGVTCKPSSSSTNTTTTSISNLSLSNLGLSHSTFLLVACEITTLESLDVSRNSLNSIPDEFFTACGKVDGLKALNFSSNKINNSLHTFSGFASLESLDLSDNFFSGEIGFKLDGLSGLKLLNLSCNRFSGSIPVHLGKFLEQFQISKNHFKGAIPEELAGYKNLVLVDISENKLTGNFPTRIVELSKLKTLVLSSNSLTGPLPKSLTRIKSLSRFAANQNHLNGTIPSGFSESLENLDLSFNDLTGSIPDDLLHTSSLQTLDLSFNRLAGTLPESMSSSNLVRLRLGSNRLRGPIPSKICRKLPRLVYLELENNSFTGAIPAGLGSCETLQLLSLAQNKFSGKLPVELGNLQWLRVLNLQANNFVGQIPTEITKLSNLLTINISSNSLKSTIPSSISLLQNLQYLDLQGNNLSGSIPATVAELNSLLELNLGKNQLSGKIPLMPTKLQYTLNLSSNLFQGSIPQSLQSASNLEVLDLSNNKFSGEIPEFLTKMDSLFELLLANNNLSGNIPTFKSSVNVSTKPGNEDLVSIPNTPPPKTSVAHKKTSVGTKIAIVLTAGFTGVVVAFVAVFLSRRFSRKKETKIESREENAPSHFIEGYSLTANSIHGASIDFGSAMEAVANSFNIVMITRFSAYYKAVMPSGNRYLVKKLNWSDKLQLASHQKFKKELEILGKLNNSHIMVPLAYMLMEDSAYLFYEYAHKGTLFDTLHSSLRKGIDWASRYSIAIGLAQGLAFLHGCSNGPVLLFDLSSKSIMLKSIKEPQIADIELSKVIDSSKSAGSLSAVAGSVGYIPPEYAYTMRITTAGNVYSFGVILLELLTGKPAVSEGTELVKWVLSNTTGQKNWDQILDFSISRASPADRSQMLAVLGIALACVNVNSEARPKMKSVPRMLLTAI